MIEANAIVAGSPYIGPICGLAEDPIITASDRIRLRIE